jgi:lysophospholipase L1-like esterase
MRIIKKRTFLTVVTSAVLCFQLLGCALQGPGRPIHVADYDDTIRVACVGDSITYGSSIKDRLNNCYPARLGRMLGNKWQVRNFGVSAATMLKKGDKPYWEQKAFRDVQTYDPHVIVIKLGTNDTKPHNWKHKDEFICDCEDMIDVFRSLPSGPRIWICYPVPAFPERWGISDKRIKNEVIPRLKKISRRTETPIIDLYRALSGRPELFRDSIHPDAEGANLIAKAVYKTLTGRQFTEDTGQPDLPRVLIIGDSISIGYFNPAKELLNGKARVYHNPGNAQHTANGLEKLNIWLGRTKWDVIHFNFGLHDVKYVDEQGKAVAVEQGKQQIPIDRYEKNIEKLTITLKRTGAKIIFATTTPVPEGAGSRIKGDADTYNAVATRIMKKHNIPVNDLYALALPRLHQIQRQKNVHFHVEGSRLLAEQVAGSIIKALEEK